MTIPPQENDPTSTQNFFNDGDQRDLTRVL
jgi:hypothetical protein